MTQHNSLHVNFDQNERTYRHKLLTNTNENTKYFFPSQNPSKPTSAIAAAVLRTTTFFHKVNTQMRSRSAQKG